MQLQKLQLSLHLASVSQHGVFGFGQLLAANNLHYQLFPHLSWQWVHQHWIKRTYEQRKILEEK